MVWCDGSSVGDLQKNPILRAVTSQSISNCTCSLTFKSCLTFFNIHTSYRRIHWLKIWAPHLSSPCSRRQFSSCGVRSFANAKSTAQWQARADEWNRPLTKAFSLRLFFACSSSTKKQRSKAKESKKKKKKKEWLPLVNNNNNTERMDWVHHTAKCKLERG